MSLFKRLFGGGSTPEAPPEMHGDYAIRPAPVKEGGRWRVSATIEKNGQTHHLIRADTLDDHETALAVSVSKAKQVIDEQGDAIFR